MIRLRDVASRTVVTTQGRYDFGLACLVVFTGWRHHRNGTWERHDHAVGRGNAHPCRHA